jgi:hypothetical protein
MPTRAMAAARGRSAARSRDLEGRAMVTERLYAIVVEGCHP